MPSGKPNWSNVFKIFCV